MSRLSPCMSMLCVFRSVPLQCTLSFCPASPTVCGPALVGCTHTALSLADLIRYRTAGMVFEACDCIWKSSPPKKKKRSTPQKPHSFLREPLPTHFGEKKNTHSLPIRSPLTEGCLTGTFASDVTLCCLENRKIQENWWEFYRTCYHLCNTSHNVLWL